jgi:hypothetical protein
MGLLLLLGNTGTAFSGALDNLGTGLESAWSVGRRLRTGYTSNIIRVRRSSDNVESDFGYLANGAVDVAAVAAFCGAGDGFLTTIYDQSGAGRDMVQATTTIQPQVVASGVANTQNSKLVAAFDGATSSRRMAVAASTALYNFVHNGTSSTIHFVCSVTNDANAQKSIIRNITAGTDVGFFIASTTSEQMQIVVQNASGAIVNASKSGTQTVNQHTVLFDADNATAADREEAWRDGVLLTGDNALTGTASGANAGRNLSMGTNSSGTNQFAGWISEIVMWSADVTASRTAFESSARTFWGLA